MSRNSSPGWVGLLATRGSVVLDEVDFVRVAIFPLERDPPRSIDIHSPSHRLVAAIGMKPQAGQFQIIQLLGLVQRIENLDATLRQILPDAPASSGLEQLLQTLACERPNHRASPWL